MVHLQKIHRRERPQNKAVMSTCARCSESNREVLNSEGAGYWDALENKCRAQGGALSQVPEIRTCAEIKHLMLSQLSHPGVPSSNHFKS